MSNKIKIGCVVVVFLFNSCTLYYTTADIDRSLKSSLNEVNSNCNTITKDFNTIRSEYMELNCQNDKDPFLTAEQLFSNFQTDLDGLMVLKNDLNQEYTEFLGYTKGMEKVSTGSEEWQKLKLTKKKFKDGLKEIQSRGNGLTNKGNEFNTFAAEKLMPAVSYCVVSDYVNKCRKGIEQIENSKMELAGSINDNAKKGKPLMSKYSKTHPDQIEEIKNEFIKIRKALDAIDQIRIDLTEITQTFEEKTKGKIKIYSCSPDWALVEQIESDISLMQKNLMEVDGRVRSGINSIQLVVKELTGQ